ncbi:3803_t:CDS:2, partial [Cetraspora pellucida]
KDSFIKESEINYLRVKLSVLNSNLASKNSELKYMKNMLTLKKGELELIKNNLAEKNSKIHFLETRLKELLPYSRLSSEQVKIRSKTDKKNDDNISVMQSLPKDLNSLFFTKYFIYKPKTENSQVDRDIQESLTQQTLISLNDNMSKESEISNEKQINNEQIKALPVVTLGTGKALVNYKYQISPIVKLVYIENRVIDFQSTMQKNSKIPSMKLFLMDMDEANKHVASHCQSHPAILFNSGSSYKDVSKISHRYTDDIKNASMVINSYLCKDEFIVFDLDRPEDDLLAIQLRFVTPLDSQKEIELQQNCKIKNILPAEPTS